jgi:hypothetical protein
MAQTCSPLHNQFKEVATCKYLKADIVIGTHIHQYTYQLLELQLLEGD